MTSEKKYHIEIIEVLPYTKGKNRQCIAKCHCGKIFKPVYSRIKNKKSCGCLGRANLLKYSTSHGMYHSREYKIWHGMRRRCNNKNASNFHLYGGRGVSICKRWDSFQNFFLDMGPRPTNKHSIDRINPFGNYEPSNCRWATYKEQGNNRRMHYGKK